ncbi:cyclophilin-like fold protein [Pseudomonas alliivorans]|nr:cyclophilin-like fold protein [Pseudomonas alliivorans]
MPRKTLRTCCSEKLLTALLCIGALPALMPHSALAETNRNATREHPMRIAMLANGKTLTFKLEDNRTSRDFIALLPLDVPLEDYASTEKINVLPRKLSTEGAAPGVTPVAGDFAYYAPWGNIAIFHKGFKYSPGLIRLGTLESDLDLIRQQGPLNVRFERIKD